MQRVDGTAAGMAERARKRRVKGNRDRRRDSEVKKASSGGLESVETAPNLTTREWRAGRCPHGIL